MTRVKRFFLPCSVEKYIQPKTIIPTKIPANNCHSHCRNCEKSLRIVVVRGSWVALNWSAIEKILGNTKRNNANTAANDITIKIIGYINAEIYLFLISEPPR